MISEKVWSYESRHTTIAVGITAISRPSKASNTCLPPLVVPSALRRGNSERKNVPKEANGITNTAFRKS